MYGYQIMTEISERSGGIWRPSPGSIYPTLQVLADEGLVISAKSEGRRVFSLTDAGRAVVDDARGQGSPAPWDEVADGADSGGLALRDRLGQVMAAAGQVAQAGSADQVTRAEAILADTRRALYRLLGEDESNA